MRLLNWIVLEQGPLPNNYRYKLGRLAYSDGISRWGVAITCQCCGETISKVYGTRELACEGLDQAAKECAALEELAGALYTVGARSWVS